MLEQGTDQTVLRYDAKSEESALFRPQICHEPIPSWL